MRRWWLLGLVALLLVAAAGIYVAAGRGAPPSLRIEKPARFVGRTGTIEVSAEAPGSRFVMLKVTIEQNGRTTPLFAVDDPGVATLTQVDADRVRITGPLDRTSAPELESGPARIVVSATRPSFLNLRDLSYSIAKDVEVRLEPPRLSVLSTHHYVNHGGSEVVVYRVSPADVRSGVRVGHVEYPGFPAPGAGDPTVRAAFFALLYDQELDAPIALFARDEAGNEATASFVDRVFEKPQRQSRIDLDEGFVRRVVPEILARTPDLKTPPPATDDDLLKAFLQINGELRQTNAEQIAALAAKTVPSKLWAGPFVQLGNSKVEAAFADRRTYFFRGREVDRQVHLGFDLAVTRHVPIVAANDGVVLFADWLGIYGQALVLDHGMGVQSLYAHLHSFDVKVGDRIGRGQQIGLSDTTGLAAGDHLHFTMLVGGRMVNPVEWWDAHWMEDRVDRKLRETGELAAPAAGR